jgi:hypothetical protein
MGEYYVTGFFKDLSLNFYDSSGNIDVSLNKTLADYDDDMYDEDTYIAKYDKVGNVSWARRIGGLNGDASLKIVTDNENIYLAGTFTSEILNFYDAYAIA